MATGSTPRIFVSHSHIDNDFGLRLIGDLRQDLGGEDAVWYDVRGGLRGGDAWWPKIVAEITTHEVFLVVLSPDAVNSKWVMDEIGLAWQEKNSPGGAGRTIIPVLYRPCTVRADLRMLQMISFVAPKAYDTAYRELLTSLGISTTPSTQQAAPAPDSPAVAVARTATPNGVDPAPSLDAQEDASPIGERVPIILFHVPGDARKAERCAQELQDIGGVVRTCFIRYAPYSPNRVIVLDLDLVPSSYDVPERFHPVVLLSPELLRYGLERVLDAVSQRTPVAPKAAIVETASGAPKLAEQFGIPCFDLTIRWNRLYRIQFWRFARTLGLTPDAQ